MPSHIVATAEGVTVAGPAIVSKPAVSARRRAGSPWTARLAAAVGRFVAGLSATSWLTLDAILLLSCLAASYGVFPPFDAETTPHASLWESFTVFLLCFTAVSLVFGLYDSQTLASRARILARSVVAVLGTTVLSYTVIYVLMYATISRRTAALSMAIYFIGICSTRLAACWAVHRLRRKLLVVGAPSLLDSFENAKGEGHLSEYDFVGFASANGCSEEVRNDKRYLGRITACCDRIEEFGVTDIVVAAHESRAPDIMEWVVRSLQRRCRLTDEATFYEKATGQILVDELTPSWFISADIRVHCDRQAMLKRTIDVLTAAVALIVALPLWPVIALLIKLEDGGPVLYSQTRVGQNGKTFRLYKFRTMRADAENGKSVWAAPDDPRATRVGRILRKSRLDELPQLYNILFGQMSFVGPRPERPDFARQIENHVPFFAERHLVKPGLTGWAQISYPYGASIADAKRKLQFDLYYLKHMSIELDLTILLRTLGTFLRGSR